MTLFQDTRDVAMSRQKGSSPSIGTEKQMGLVPKNGSPAPKALTSASAFVNANDAYPRCDACREKNAAAPKCVERRTPTTPTPQSPAISTARRIATVPAWCPNARSASIVAAAGRRMTTRRSGVVLIRPPSTAET